MEGEAPVRGRARRTRGRFSVGYILSETFSAWFRNLLPFLLITVIVLSPVLVFNWVTIQDAVSRAARSEQPKVDVRTVVTNLASVVLQYVLAGAFTFGVVRKLQGRPAGLGECVSVGFARLPAVLSVSLLVGLIMAAIALPGEIVPAIRLPVALVSVWVGCILVAAVPAAVIERPGVVGALRRSADLTRGHRGTVFGALFVLGLLLGAVIMVAILGLLARRGEADTASVVRTVTIGTLALTIVFGSLQAVSTAVVYHGLRQEKEGVSADELAKVFE